MRNARVWRALLGVDKMLVDEVEFSEDDELLVVRVRPVRAMRDRCGICRRRCGRYDAGEGRRRWRALDLGTVRAFVEADAPRVTRRLHVPAIDRDVEAHLQGSRRGNRLHAARV